MTIILPNKPSELIRIALHDLRRVEVDGRYAIDMDTWHEPKADGLCHVCLAGAVLAGTLCANPNEDVIPGSHTRENARQLDALNALRCGDVTGAIYLVLAEDGEEYPEENHPLDRSMPDYDQDREIFHAEMAQLATDLEAAGL